MRRTVVGSVVGSVIVAACLLAVAAVRAADRAPAPNVLFLIADDASCHFGETYGCRWATTPAIDAVAREGIVFDRAYVPTSKCAPCRAALLTGRNPWQLGEAANHWPVFPPQFMSFTEVLAARGIACGADGKVWGPGDALDAAGKPRTWGLKRAGGKGVGPGAAFRDFLATRRPGQPFFYWFGSGNPHRIYKPDAGLAACKKPADIDRVPAFWPDTEVVRRDMLDYATEIEAFDREVAAILEALVASGEAENTLVIVTSDHGMPFPRIKGHTFDLAHRVPLVMRWPRGIVHPGRRVAALTSFIDIAPTILDLFAIDGVAAGMRPITGASLVDLLDDAPQRPRDRVIVGRERNDARARRGSESGLGYPARAIRRGDLFYVHNFAPDRWPCGDPDLGFDDTDAGPTKAAIEAAGEADRFWQLCFGKRPADELYDLAADPDCVRNLAADAARKADVDRLKAELFAELERQEDPRVLGHGDTFEQYHSPQQPPADWPPAGSLPAFASKVQLWNCGGAEPTADGKGLMLHRAPKAVREALDTKTPDGKEVDGAKQMRVAVHGEIRFVLEDGEKPENVKLHLRNEKGASVFWFWGDILAGEARLPNGDRAKPITPNGHGLMFSLLEQYPKGRFANRVCRVVVQGLDVEFTDIEGRVRPPKPDELGAPVMLSYGTSISQGAYASRPDLGWNALTARLLGHDFLNMGSSGTAYCEPAMADYLAGLDWDAAVLELSVNMGGFPIEQFKDRVGSLVDKLAKSHPDAPIVCISLFPFGTGDMWAQQKAGTQERRDALAEIVKNSGHANVHFVSGPDLLSFSGLSPDMLHPTDQGMIEIAHKLAPRIRSILDTKNE